jgi:hypothetical protein
VTLHDNSTRSGAINLYFFVGDKIGSIQDDIIEGHDHFGPTKVVDSLAKITASGVSYQYYGNFWVLASATTPVSSNKYGSGDTRPHNIYTKKIIRCV